MSDSSTQPPEPDETVAASAPSKAPGRLNPLGALPALDTPVFRPKNRTWLAFLVAFIIALAAALVIALLLR